MTITADHFEARTGSPPKDDDLDRSNCPDAGRIGHSCCGWDEIADMPVFITGNQHPRREGGDVAG